MDMYLAGVPQSLDANSDNLTWVAPAGIYPTEVFPAGLSYQVTYRTLQNLSDIQTQTTTETILQITLSQNNVYIYIAAASILNSNFGQAAVTTFATGEYIYSMICNNKSDKRLQIFVLTFYRDRGHCSHHNKLHSYNGIIQTTAILRC